MTILGLIKYLRQYPLKLLHDFWAYQVYNQTTFAELFLPRKKITKTIGKRVKMEFNLDGNAHEKLMYLGLYEYPIYLLMRKVLKADDIFVDVGANIGYFTAIAASLLGKSGEVHAFEPDQRYFKKLFNLAKMNPGRKMAVNNIALGDKRQKANLFETKEFGMSSLVKGLRNKKQVKDTVEVRVERLDDYIEKNIKNKGKIKLIKIDVEGFERSVLNGLSKCFESNMFKPVILMEVYPHAWKLQGGNIKELTGLMNKYGYKIEPGVDLGVLKAGEDDVYNVIFNPNKN